MPDDGPQEGTRTSATPSTAEPSPLDIAGSLRGERLFITGATGFIGRVLVEKLLWSVPEVGRLLLLIRPDDDRSAAERLRDEVLESPVMARLRARHADDWEVWAGSKVEAVPGDLGEDRFGLDPEAYAALCGGVDRVVASAATVTFDERLDRAVELNARGALRGLTLARDAGDVPLLHVSTCFVSGRRRGAVAERVTAPETGPDGDFHLDATLAELDEACRCIRGKTDAEQRLVTAGSELAERYGFHDVYTFSKALGEWLLERHRGKVPIAVVRPAIVESAAAQPLAGWIDAVRVADPLLVAYGRGRSRDFPGDPAATLDIVPVDYVVHAILAALAALERPAAGGGGIRVYQVSSSRNPIFLGELVAHAREGFQRTPLRDARDESIEVKEARFVEPGRYRRKLLARRARVRFLAERLRSTRFGPRLGAAQRTLDHFVHLLEVYRPYLDHGARFRDQATRELWGRLSAAEREEFPFEVAHLDWRSYVARAHVPGIIRYALRAESGAPAPTRPDDSLAEIQARGGSPVAGASTLFELFAAVARTDPDAVAFQTCRQGRWLRYTYGQALTATANIAASLASRYGIGRGDRVVLWASGSPEWALMTFAVHRLGAAIVPLDPQWPAAEVDAATRFTGAKLICAAPALRAALGDARCPVVELAAPWVPEPAVGLLPGAETMGAVGDANDLASILFTSGTTVAPKAVPLTHANYLANVCDLVPLMQLRRERLLSVLPIHHVFEQMVGLLVPLAGGSTISYVAEIKPAEISWMMNATRPTVLVAVPRLLELLHEGILRNVAAGGPALGALFRVLLALSKLTGGRYGHRLFGKVHRRFGGSLRRIATGGSALEPSLGESFRWMGFQVAEGYGMTETSPVLTVNPWRAIRFGSVGRPLPGVEVELRPTAGSVNGDGEIWVRGANVMAGYYRAPGASEEVLRDGWLNTGDVGSFDADGYLRISGRTKDVIVTGAGKNVYPEEVERRYRDLPQVEELVVLGLPGNGRGERVSAVVVPRADATEREVEKIRATIAERSGEVPSYQQITRVEIWRGELPKTTTFKVKRGPLREAVLAGGGNGASAPEAASRTPAAVSASGNASYSEEEAWVLKTLARLVRARPEHLGAGERLAELGVDSLTRVELVAEIESRFSLNVDDRSAASLSRVQDVFDLL